MQEKLFKLLFPEICIQIDDQVDMFLSRDIFC